MDRLKREANPPTGQLASPVPQYKDTVLNDWAEVKGEGGASYVKDRDVIAALSQIQNELAKVKAELATIKANQLSGDQKVQLSGNFISHSTIPKPEGFMGASLLWMDTKQVFLHDGTDWREW